MYPIATEEMKFNPNRYFYFDDEMVISPFCASCQLYLRRDPKEDYGLTQEEMEDIFGKEYLAWLEEVGDGVITDEDEEMENGIPQPTEYGIRLYITKDDDGFKKFWKEDCE